MTATTTVQTETEAASAPVAQVEHIDPNAIEFETNIRTDVTLDPGFVASIKNEGVLLPVLARRDDNGTVYVRDGQRRTLAAREAGLSTIPAYFGAADLTNAERIVQQLVTNDRRADLSAIERVNAYEQLTLEGLSVTKIAKATGADKAEVAASVTLAKSETARAALTGQVSFERALLIAEFDGDVNAEERIMGALDEDLDYEAECIRQDRAIHQKYVAAVEQARASGLRVADDRAGLTWLHNLTDAAEDATDRPQLTAETHQECPGRIVTLAVWSVKDDDVRAEEFCDQPELHNPRYRTSATSANPVAAEELTAEQVEAEQEAKRTERRRLIANNKAWDAAEVVRREWIAKFLSRKTLPKDAAAFVAVTLTAHIYDVNNDNSGKVGTYLGMEQFFGREKLAATVVKNPTRAGHVSLAVALSGRENATSRDSWRSPRDGHATYLRQLETWGYHLSNVERIAAQYPEVEADDTGE